jgi:uncharacterized lipoprotein NlpE involved in copper resistance
MVRKRIIALFLVLIIFLAGCSVQSEPDVGRIKADLIGRQLIFYGMPFWTFETLSEFEQFDIQGKQIQGDILEYEVRMKLRYLGTDEYHIADVFIIYTRTNTSWELNSIVPTSWE